MSNDPTHTTWGTVRPRLERELEQIRDSLMTAKIEEVPALQAHALALQSVRAWFLAGSPSDKPMISDDPSY